MTFGDRLRAGRFWRWVPGERKTVWLCAVLLGLTVGSLPGIYHTNGKHAPVYALGDFFAIWSYGKIVLTHKAALLYSMQGLHAAQVKLGMPADNLNPFPYPPIFLLMVWPLGLVSFHAAYPFWVGVTLLAYLASLAIGTTRSGVVALAALFVPTTAVCFAIGQTGFLLGALLIGGARLADRRPVLAGMLFALLAYKPQFGILVPVALLAAGRWRCIVATVAGLAVLFVVSSVLFGPSIWATWLHSLPAYETAFAKAETANKLIRLAPTVAANLLALGVPHMLAWIGQLAAGVAAAAATWIAWRRGSPLAVPVLLGATFLATPHALVYDMPALSGAVLLFAAYRLRTAGALELPELAVLVLVLLDPLIMTSALRLPVGGLLVALFVVLVCRADQAVTPPVAQMAKA